MTVFDSFYGIITKITDITSGTNESNGCYKLMTIQNRHRNIVNFVIAPTTYFVDHMMMSVGDTVIGFYDTNTPTPLIYPPQYRAIVVARLIPGQNVKVDYFDEQLISSDGTLKLNIAPYTEIILENDQLFAQNPANHNLIVIYGPTTRSIPAQTTPYKIIVICSKT